MSTWFSRNLDATGHDNSASNWLSHAQRVFKAKPRHSCDICAAFEHSGRSSQTVNSATSSKSSNAFQPNPSPDPGQVFDKLLARKSPASSTISNLAYAFQIIIFLELCSTTPPSFNLSALYGRSPSDENRVRARERGLLLPDCFFDDRVSYLPPAATALLILWNRNHNYIARRILLGNASLLHDEDIFKRARQINCAQFKDVVCNDFLKAFFSTKNGGAGRHCSEILSLHKNRVGNVIWVKQSFNVLFDWNAVSFEKRAIAGQSMIYQGLQRGSDGYLRDDDLAQILFDATEAVGNAVHLPSSVKRIMEQGRIEKVCSLNQFRRYLGLRPFNDFDEWNPDIANEAKELYEDINSLELFPGLYGEKSTDEFESDLGVTMLCGLFTGILTLFHTDPSTPIDWADEESPPIADGSFGAVLPRILLRNLPRHYPFNSVYALFPFFLPSFIEGKINDGKMETAAYDLPAVRPARREIKHLTTLTAIRHVFEDLTAFSTIHNQHLRDVAGDYGYFLGFDNQKHHNSDLVMSMYGLVPCAAILPRYATFFRDTATIQIKRKSRIINGSTRSIDIVRDVINKTCTLWSCEMLCGLPIMPEGLKSNARMASEAITLDEMFEKHANIFGFVMETVDPHRCWDSRLKAMADGEDLRLHSEDQLRVAVTAFHEGRMQKLLRILEELFTPVRLEDQATLTFMSRLVEYGRTYDDADDFMTGQDVDRKSFRRRRVVNNLTGLCILTCINCAQACSRIVDFYLNEKNSEDLQRIQELVVQKDDVDAKLLEYIRKALLLTPSSPIFRDVKRDSEIPFGGSLGSIRVKQGDRLFADFQSAYNNLTDVEKRSMDPDSLIFGMGLHRCPGIKFFDKVMPQFIKPIFQLKNLRHAPGTKGQLHIFRSHPAPQETDPRSYLNVSDNLTKLSSVPGSLFIHFEDRKDNNSDSDDVNVQIACHGYLEDPQFGVPYKHATRLKTTVNYVSLFLALFVVKILASLFWNVLHV